MGFFKRKRAILLAVAIGTFMSALDSSVVNLVLPNISSYFHTSLSTIEWDSPFPLYIYDSWVNYYRFGNWFVSNAE